MKSAYKYELADAAGVSPSTFYRWLSRNRSALARLGASPKTKLLPPRAVEWICHEYGIDL
jgi:predicted DNA-binding transcriptional regulator AlpA